MNITRYLTADNVYGFIEAAHFVFAILFVALGEYQRATFYIAMAVYVRVVRKL